MLGWTGFLAKNLEGREGGVFRERWIMKAPSVQPLMSSQRALQKPPSLGSTVGKNGRKALSIGSGVGELVVSQACTQ